MTLMESCDFDRGVQYQFRLTQVEVATNVSTIFGLPFSDTNRIKFPALCFDNLYQNFATV